MSEDDFIARFRPQFPDWATKCGIMSPQAVAETAGALALAKNYLFSRDYEEVITYAGHPKTTGIVIWKSFTRDGLGKLVPEDHMMLLLRIDTSAFVAWSPCSDGSSQVLEYPRSEWVPLQCRGTILTSLEAAELSLGN
jgi:hypothetical protein